MKYPWRVVTGQDQLGNVSVFTTRADTLFGVTYVVLAPEHPEVKNLKSKIKNWEEVNGYIETTKKKSELDRQQSKEKTGVELKGIKAVNPVNGEAVPVWIADYVLSGYGTGAVMAVPAHDERDFEFAEKYKLPSTHVICPLIDRNFDITKDNYSFSVVMIIEDENGKILVTETEQPHTIHLPSLVCQSKENYYDACLRTMKDALHISPESILEKRSIGYAQWTYTGDHTTTTAP
jgi:leucyl-tRNA synthetase